MKFAVKLWANESVQVELLGQEDGTIVAVLDGVDLEPEVVQYAIEYGFRQSIRDRAAASKNDAERNAMARKRIEALQTNTLGEGGGGGPKLTPVERVMRSLAERDVTAAFASADNAEWVAAQRKATGLTEAALRDHVVKLTVANDDGTLRARAQAELDEASKRLNLTGLVIPKPQPKTA